MKRAELRKLLVKEMDAITVWDEIDSAVGLENVAWAKKLGVSTPGDLIPIPMEDLDLFLERNSKSDILLMGIQSERFLGDRTVDGANLSDEYFCLGRLGYFTSIPASLRSSWLGSFLESQDVVDYADDEQLEYLADIYDIDLGDDGIEEDDE